MKRLNTKLKLLSMALVGLGGLGLAGGAFAACPSGPTTADGGAWAASSHTSGSLTIVGSNAGYDGTNCRLDAAIVGDIGGATAFVADTSPSNEGTYRAQFLVNLDNLAPMSSAGTISLFQARNSAYVNGIQNIVTVLAQGTGSGLTLYFITPCASGFNHACVGSFNITAPGTQRIEISWKMGSGDGYLKAWINNGNEGSPDVTIANIDNSAWTGVDAAVLGLSNPSPLYRSINLNQSVGFDQFDSRRNTFIGVPAP